MKKKLTAILCTSLAVLMLSSLSAPVLAADYGGKVAYDQAGILRFGVEKVKPGQSYLAPDGQSVPSVITYTDPSGGKTNYLPVQLLAELVDVPVTWNAWQKSVSIGCDPREVIVDGSNALPSEEKKVSVPEYGQRVGVFTEIDPSTMDAKWTRSTMPREMTATVKNGLHDYVIPGYPGQISLVKVTNNGTNDQLVRVYHEPTVTNGSDAEAFASVILTPGQTLTRAFRADDDADTLKTTLMMIVDPCDEPIVDLTNTSITYGYNIRHTSPGVTVSDRDA